MAYTATLVDQTVLGDQRVRFYSVAADAVSGVVQGGFSRVMSVSLTPQSMNSAGVKVKINATTAAAASNGSVNIADATSGDVFYLIVYGI